MSDQMIIYSETHKKKVPLKAAIWALWHPFLTLLQAVTINTNVWTNAGHAVNHLYDILYMMDRDDIAVGVGGEGGILNDGTILPNVGGYLPIIEQVWMVNSFLYLNASVTLLFNSSGQATLGFNRIYMLKNQLNKP